jgi:hypothetical protein
METTRRLLEKFVEIFNLPDLYGVPPPVNFRITFTACKPASLAPLLPMTTRSGTPFGVIACLGNRPAAARSPRSESRKSVSDKAAPWLKRLPDPG